MMTGPWVSVCVVPLMVTQWLPLNHTSHPHIHVKARKQQRVGLRVSICRASWEAREEAGCWSRQKMRPEQGLVP